MTRRRFHAPPGAFTSNRSRVTLASDEARHLREVLRLKAGDDVSVFDGEGHEFHCRVSDSRRDKAELEIISEIAPAKPESPLRLTLAVALLKGEKFDLVVQKATELGVTSITPLVTNHADIRLRDAADAAKRVARWQRIALEATKQSGRAVVPLVTDPIAFKSLIETQSQPAGAAGGGWQGLMFSERDGASLAEWRQRNPIELSALTAIIGSEGGWADEEILFAREAGWSIITLGGRTLRAETAAIAVATLLQHRFGDLVRNEPFPEVRRTGSAWVACPITGVRVMTCMGSGDGR